MVLSYLTYTFFRPDNKDVDLNLSPTLLAELEAFKAVTYTVAKKCGRSKPLAAPYYLLTLGALTRYALLFESKVSLSSSSSSAWHPLPSFTEYLEAVGSMSAMPSLPERMNILDSQIKRFLIRPIRTAISILHNQELYQEAAALAIHVLPSVERPKIVSFPFKIRFMTDCYGWILFYVDGCFSVGQSIKLF